MRKLIALFLIALCAPVIAQAASQSLIYTWGVPTTRTDGSVLPVTQLSGYELSYSVDGSAAVIVPVTGGSTATATVTLNLVPKGSPYVIRSSIWAIDTNGQKSAATQITTNLTVLPATPSAPTVFKLTVTCVNGACSLVVN